MLDPAVGSALPELVTHDIGSHLVEQLFSVLPPGLYADTVERLQGNVVSMALHPTANYVLKQLVTNAPSKEQV